ncbi:MAG: hypothetical protein O9256_03850 [Rhizobiaceae bacterium]|jgi:hypothetical protein|nr:hypothetical protein [Rhizobiaceae bacterium]
MTAFDERWESFLDPDVLRPSLLNATMFITTFEILKDTVKDRVRDFYTHGFGPGGPAVDPDYQQQVASRNKSILYASLDWLREQGAIDVDDLKLFEELRTTRNLLAHKLFMVVSGQVPSQHSSQLPMLFGLLRKIETWWVVNVEIPIAGDFSAQDIDESQVVPGSIISLQMLIEVASGNKELLEYWRDLRRRRGVES